MKTSYKTFRTMYVDYPDYPETERFVVVSQRTVYINRCANPGAKLVRLIFR